MRIIIELMEYLINSSRIFQVNHFSQMAFVPRKKDKEKKRKYFALKFNPSKEMMPHYLWPAELLPYLDYLNPSRTNQQTSTAPLNNELNIDTNTESGA